MSWSHQAAVVRARCTGRARDVVEGVDDAAALDLDAGHVADVGVADQAAVEGIGRVVLGHRVAADVDVAAVARGGSRQRVARVDDSRCRPGALEDVVHLDAADGRADGVVAERGDDDRHPLLAGGLVAGDAEDPDLGVGTGVDQRVGAADRRRCPRRRRSRPRPSGPRVRPVEPLPRQRAGRRWASRR